MIKTTVVNVRSEPYDIYIGRANIHLGEGESEFHNPFKIDEESGTTRARAIKQFRDYFYTRLENEPEFKESVFKLKGKRLGCWCKPNPCHGDVIVEYLEQS
jgi:hypothetical protein